MVTWQPAPEGASYFRWSSQLDIRHESGNLQVCQKEFRVQFLPYQAGSHPRHEGQFRLQPSKFGKSFLSSGLQLYIYITGLYNSSFTNITAEVFNPTCTTPEVTDPETNTMGTIVVRGGGTPGVSRLMFSSDRFSPSTTCRVASFQRCENRFAFRVENASTRDPRATRSWNSHACGSLQCQPQKSTK